MKTWTIRIRLLVVCLLLFSFVACQKNVPKPPVAKIIPKDVTVHGDERIDNYFWLRERDNPEAIEYLNAENA